MQSITLTDEQREFRAVLRQFCDDKIAPRAAEVDREAKYPWDNYEALKSMDIPALGVPAEYGGAGADNVTQ
ncbi:MAG: acyl-CoA dehydrogenase family protein, partial [Actinobacteria bacterium]|nr:acyl-CoA dehydrogenase family protein [Actinomycetota bacterium]